MDHASAVRAKMVDVSWDPRLIALTYLVAVLVSYAPLDLAGVVSLARQGPGRAAWLFFGAVAMGLGIWSMHFTGMLAFEMGVPVSYDVPLVVSALVAVAASVLALSVASRREMTDGTFFAAGPVMRLGLVGMHYAGMGAMRMTAEQLLKLREIDCDLAQGYYLSKPLPEDAMYEMLRSFRGAGQEDPGANLVGGAP